MRGFSSVSKVLRSKRRRGAILAAVATPLAFLAASRGATGCANLPDVTPDQCGNGIVETNEDCDQPEDAGTSSYACWQPGDSTAPANAACRFRCGAVLDGGTLTCPSGYNCGLDNVCRAPQGIECDGDGCTFAATSALNVSSIASATDLQAVDLDGDKITDIVATTTAGVSTAYFNAARTATAGQSIVQALARPSVAQLITNTDAGYQQDIMVDLSGGLGVFASSASRTLSPVTNPSLSVPGSYAITGYQTLMAGSSAVTTSFFVTDGHGAGSVTPPSSMAALQGCLTKTVGAARAATVPETSGGCTQVIAVPSDDGTTSVVSLFTGACGSSDGSVQAYTPTPTIALDTSMRLCDASTPTASGVPCEPLHVADTNGDGRDDLILTVNTANGRQVLVSHGSAGGRFGDPVLLFGSPPTDAACPGGAIGACGLGTPIPLAFGDFNHDGLPDIVDATGIFIKCVDVPDADAGSTDAGDNDAGDLDGGDVDAGEMDAGTSDAGTSDAGTSDAGAPPPTCWVNVGSPEDAHVWAEAAIGDFNGDGWPDVLVRDASQPSMTLFRNTTPDALGQIDGGTITGTLDAGQQTHVASIWNPIELPTGAPVIAFGVGDYDGDLIDDIAYAEQDPNASPVSVVFGATSGVPVGPIDLGAVPGVTQIVPSIESGVASDLVTNPYVVAHAGGGTNVYLFAGDTARQVNAPYLLLDDRNPQLQNPRRSTAYATGADTATIVLFTSPSNGCLDDCTQLWVLPVTDQASQIVGSPPTQMACPLSGSSSSSSSSSSGGAYAVTIAALPPDGSTPPGVPYLLNFDKNKTRFGLNADVVMTALTPAGQPPVVVLAGYGTASVTTNGIAVFSGPIDGNDAGVWSANASTLSLMDADGGLASARPFTGVKLLPIDMDGNGTGVALVIPADPSFPNIPAQACYVPWTGTSLASAGVCASLGDARVVSAAPYPLANQGTKHRLLVATGEKALSLTLVSGVLAAQALTLGSGSQPQGGSAIATGDFDGDGILDVILATTTGINAFYGSPYNAGHPTTSGSGQ